MNNGNLQEDYKQAMRQLFDALPHGAVKQIADNLGLSTRAIYYVRDCVYENQEVVDEAKRIILEEKNRIETQKRSLIEFVDQELPAPTKLSA